MILIDLIARAAFGRDRPEAEGAALQPEALTPRIGPTPLRHRWPA